MRPNTNNIPKHLLGMFDVDQIIEPGNRFYIFAIKTE